MLHIKNDYYIKAGARSYILMKKLSKKEKPEVIDTEDGIESVAGYKNKLRKEMDDLLTEKVQGL